MWGGLGLNFQTNSIITAVMSKKTREPVCLSLYLSLCTCLCDQHCTQPVCLSIYLSLLPFYLCVLSTCLCWYVTDSVCLSCVYLICLTCLSDPPVYLYTNMAGLRVCVTNLSNNISVSVHICPTCKPLSLSVTISVWRIFPSVFTSVSPCLTCYSLTHLSLNLSATVPIWHLSVSVPTWPTCPSDYQAVNLAL